MVAKRLNTNCKAHPENLIKIELHNYRRHNLRHSYRFRTRISAAMVTRQDRNASRLLVEILVNKVNMIWM